MKGKTVVITGGTSGIGEIAAERLAQMGARIVLIARDKSALIVYVNDPRFKPVFTHQRCQRRQWRRYQRRRHQTVSILRSFAGTRWSRGATAGSALAVPRVTARNPAGSSTDVMNDRRSMASFSSRKRYDAEDYQTHSGNANHETINSQAARLGSAAARKPVSLPPKIRLWVAGKEVLL
jgi:hypothetical protein